MSWLTDVLDHQRSAAVSAHLASVLDMTRPSTATPEHNPGPSRPALPAAWAGPAPTGGVASTSDLPAGPPRSPGSAGPDRVPPRAPVRAGSNVSPISESGRQA